MSNEITIITPEHVELRFEIAGPGSRLLAMLVDELILLITTVVIVLLLIAFSIMPTSTETISSSVIGITLVLLMFLRTLYYFLFETYMSGKTPGKHLLGLRVIRDTGHALDVRGALLRNLLRLVDQIPAPPFYAVGSVVVFFSAQSRRVGDYVGGTLVVREPQKMSKIEKEASPELYQTVAHTEVPVIPMLPEQVLSQIGAITKDDYRAVRHLLDRSMELDTYVVNAAAWKMVTVLCEKMQYDPSEIRDPLQFLFALTTEWERRKVH